MKVALLNAFPNLLHSAEREFIERCVAVLTAMGHDARSVVTSDDIIVFDPDLVIVTHEFVAKTTDHFTAGLLWSPTQFYRDDDDRLKAIRSWDLVVPINAATRRFARNLHFPTRHASAVSEIDFYPSAPLGDLPAADASALSLAYVGAHWDGPRHGALLEELARITDLHVYGPPKAWDFLPRQYRGPIPFDGRSLVQTLHRHGVVLALHKPEHVEEDTPSMRVFEACAARCAVITEPLAPLVELFGDAAYYVDASMSPRRQAHDIAAFVDRLRADPSLFERQVSRLHEAFRSKACLEKLLSSLLEDVAARRAAAASVACLGPADPEVSVIIRCGARPLSMLQRAVSSVAAQSHRRIGLILVRFAPIDGFDDWLAATRATGRFTSVREVAAAGDGVRSAAMWAGLRAVDSELFCMLDDDDELFRDHVASLVAVLARDPDCDVAYSGVVRQEEDGVFLNEHVRFRGELGIEVPERRALKFMDDHNLDRLLRFDNYIQSNTWLARRRVLTGEVLDDPGLEVSEDVYFYLLLAARHRFQFSGRVSAVWNWRSNAADNSMLAVSQHRWARCRAELRLRLAQLQFPGAFAGRDVIGVGRLRSAADGAPAAPVVAAPAATTTASMPRTLAKRMLRAITGRRAFLTAADAPPCDPADVEFSIDFTAPALPAFLASVRGLSDLEPWGCWTDGPALTLEFRRPPPPRFVLHLVGHAFETLHDKDIVIELGRHRAMLRMSARRRAARYSVDMLNPDGACSLVFRMPDARSPSSMDPRSRETRRLGIGLVRLDVVQR